MFLDVDAYLITHLAWLYLFLVRSARSHLAGTQVVDGCTEKCFRGEYVSSASSDQDSSCDVCGESIAKYGPLMACTRSKQLPGFMCIMCMNTYLQSPKPAPATGRSWWT